MAAPLYVYKVICSKLCPRLGHKLLWTIPVMLECFSTVTRLLTLTEKCHIGKSLNLQIVFSLLSFFRGHSTTMTEAITIIQMRRSATGSGLLYPHHNVLKQIKPFSRDSQALEASSCRYSYTVLFRSVLRIKWMVTPTPETQPRARAVLLRHL